MQPESNTRPLLTAQNIRKRFGHVTALDGVDFQLHQNEIVSIVGDNGSGKSTFIKILSGIHKPDAGTIEIAGENYSFLTPKLSLQQGISTVYQDLSLDNYRDVASNIFLGNEMTLPGGILRRKEMKKVAFQLIESLDIGIPDISLPVENLSGGQRQAVAVARSVHQGKKIILFDEPTAAMGLKESAAVLRLIRQLKQRGLTIVIISHNLHHVFDISDRICMMRQGKIQHTVRTCDTTMEEMQNRIIQSESGVSQ